MKYEFNEDTSMRLVENNRNIIPVILNSKKGINILCFSYGI
jgi:hypothetical protein